MWIKYKYNLRVKACLFLISTYTFSNISLMPYSQAVQIQHKYAVINFETDKTQITPNENLSVTFGLNSMATPSFKTISEFGCPVRPHTVSDFSMSEYSEFNETENLRFSYGVVFEFLQKNKRISGPYFISVAMLHDGTMVEGKSNGSDLGQIIDIDSHSNGATDYVTQLERLGASPIQITGRNAKSFPINFNVPETGDILVQYYFDVSQYQTSDMSTQQKKEQNYACGGYTAFESIFSTGKQVIVLSNSSKQSQSITFFPMPKSTALNLQALQLQASSSSGNRITYNSLTPNICLVNESILILRKTGICKIEAIATESSQYAKSPSVVKTLSIVPKGSKYEIICLKGTSLKNVYGYNPKCPKGYREL